MRRAEIAPLHCSLSYRVRLSEKEEEEGGGERRRREEERVKFFQNIFLIFYGGIGRALSSGMIYVFDTPEWGQVSSSLIFNKTEAEK